MIRVLHLEDFQAHALSRFEFVPGINTIVGTSDHGKSAVLRALYWVLWNRPSGLGIVRRGSKTCSVDFEYEGKDGNHTVRRVRGPTNNEYEVDGSSFRAVGRAVPEALTTAVPLREINVQRQFDPPFLIFATPGAVADTLNRFTGLHLAAKVVDVLGARVSSSRSKITSLEQERTQEQQRLASLGWVSAYEAVVVKWEDANEQVVATARDVTDLTDCLDRMGRIAERHSRARVLLKAQRDRTARIVTHSNELARVAILAQDKTENAEALRDTIGRNTRLAYRTEAARAALRKQTHVASVSGVRMKELLAVSSEREALLAQIARLDRQSKYIGSMTLSWRRAKASLRVAEACVAQWKPAWVRATAVAFELTGVTSGLRELDDATKRLTRCRDRCVSLHAAKHDKEETLRKARIALTECLKEFTSSLDHCPYCEQKLTSKAVGVLSSKMLGGAV